MSPEVWKKYEEKRQHVENYFVEANFEPDTRIAAMSPSGDYRLDIDNYKTKPGSWSYSRGVVRRVRDEAIVADVKRNFGHFPYAWVQHPDGNEYLLCGEDYQGYTVLNLGAGKASVFFSAAAVEGIEFCWVRIYPSPDGSMLAVEGCVWAWPYEVRFYDFSKPNELPLPQVDRIEDTGEVAGWEDADTFVVSHEYEFRKSDGKRYDELSPEEQEELLQDWRERMEYASETVRWKRPRTGAMLGE